MKAVVKQTNYNYAVGRVRPKIIGAICFGLIVISHAALGFTQSGAGTFISNTIPIGHEWVTRLAALELLGGDPITRPDPKDPRKNWVKGKAKNIDLSDSGAKAEIARIKKQRYADNRYQSTYKVVYDAIVGERWVDIGGFNVTNSQSPFNYNCHDAVTQEPPEVQYDHFMRRYDERGAAGGVQAAQRSRERFIRYFVAAAMAPSTLMTVWDGGGYSARTDVDRNYFLFGRAVHLFEDAFSSEHAVRIASDNYERVRQVKSYLCAAGSEQHTHSKKKVFDYTSGDVIWKPGTQIDPTWSAYKPSNMKDIALVATEATKDLWAAFIRTMGIPRERREKVATAEATQLAENWFYIDEGEALTWYADNARRDKTYVLASDQTGKGQTVAQCMKGLGVKSGDQMEKVRELAKVQRICLYNVQPVAGYSDLFDPSLHMPFNWAWKSKTQWKKPPANWKLPKRPADTGVRVKIKSVQNGQYLSAPDGLKNNNWIYSRAGAKPLEFILVGNADNGFYRLSNANLFLSYRATTGAVKLYSSPKEASYQLEKVKKNGAYAIKNLRWKQYMWLSKESPYITRRGNPAKDNAQWIIEGLPTR